MGAAASAVAGRTEVGPGAAEEVSRNGASPGVAEEKGDQERRCAEGEHARKVVDETCGCKSPREDVADCAVPTDVREDESSLAKSGSGAHIGQLEEILEKMDALDDLNRFMQEELLRDEDGGDFADHDLGRQEIVRYRKFIRNLSRKMLTETSLLSDPQKKTTGSESMGNQDGAASASWTTVRKDQKLTKMSTMERTRSDDEGNEIEINQYLLGKLLGVGTFGVVVEAVDRLSGEKYAVKIIDQHRMRRRRSIGLSQEQPSSAIHREIAIQKRLSHKNILRLVEVIEGEDHSKTYLVTKLIEGGALMPDTSRWEPLQQERARKLFAQLVSALDYLHKHNIIHKDIKPSNLLVETATDTLYLSDFGAAQVFKDDEMPMINSTEGTMAFIAPEMCSGKEFNGKLADIWACGATLYMMLFGHPPFIADNPHALIEKINRAELEQGDDEKLPSFDLANDLLRNILSKDLEQRFTLDQIAAHSWCTNGGSDLPELAGTVSPIQVSRDEVEAAVSTLQKNSFQRVGATVWLAKRSIIKVRSNQQRRDR